MTPLRSFVPGTFIKLAKLRFAHLFQYREEHSLAVYVFTSDKKFRDKGELEVHCPSMHSCTETKSLVFENTKSGAALANETIISPGIPGAPVGGVGASGCQSFSHRSCYGDQLNANTDGYYAGKWAFEQFTHWRVTLDNPGWYVMSTQPHLRPILRPSHLTT